MMRTMRQRVTEISKAIWVMFSIFCSWGIFPANTMQKETWTFWSIKVKACHTTVYGTALQRWSIGAVLIQCRHLGSLCGRQSQGKVWSGSSTVPLGFSLLWGFSFRELSTTALTLWMVWHQAPLSAGADIHCQGILGQDMNLWPFHFNAFQDFECGVLHYKACSFELFKGTNVWPTKLILFERNILMRSFGAG